MPDLRERPPTPGEQAQFIARLRAVLEVLPPALDRQVAPLSLTSYEFALLDTVQAADGGRLRLSLLATSTNATLPRLSRVVDALERKGLIAREPSDQDARAKEAVLTEAGRATLQDARPVMDQALQRLVLSPLTAEQLRGASAALGAILEVLDPERRLAVTHPDRSAPRS